MAKKGYTPPDKTKRYAVVEIPTSGPKKDQITQIFDDDLHWDDAQQAKDRIAATRQSKYATVVEDSKLGEGVSDADLAKYLGVKPSTSPIVDDATYAAAAAPVTGSSLDGAAAWPTPDGNGPQAVVAVIASGVIATDRQLLARTDQLAKELAEIAQTDGIIGGELGDDELDELEDHDTSELQPPTSCVFTVPPGPVDFSSTASIAVALKNAPKCGKPIAKQHVADVSEIVPLCEEHLTMVEAMSGEFGELTGGTSDDELDELEDAGNGPAANVPFDPPAIKKP